MNALDILSAGLFILIGAGTVYHIFSAFCVWRFFSSSASEECPLSRYPPVSIIKPIKGMDPDLKNNLMSFCRQDYPRYEVLLGFGERNDGAIRQVKKSIPPSLYDSVHVVVTSGDLGVNRKVSNLQGIVDAARYNLFAISDSDMLVDKSYIRKIVHEFQSEKNTGMVTNLYKISDPGTIGAALESLTIALDVMPSVLVARRLEGVTFGLGASMLISRKGLDDIGGLSDIAGYLADDYQLGNRLWKRGYKIIISRMVVENIVGRMTIADYIKHQIRWARTYRSSRPKGFAGYGITHIVPFALLLMLLEGATPLSLSALGTALSIRYCQAAVVYRKVIQSRRWLKKLPLLPFKDMFAFGFWAWSFAGSSVTWRGRKYKMIKGGKMIELAQKQKTLG